MTEGFSSRSPFGTPKITCFCGAFQTECIIYMSLTYICIYPSYVPHLHAGIDLLKLLYACTSLSVSLCFLIFLQPYTLTVIKDPHFPLSHFPICKKVDIHYFGQTNWVASLKRLSGRRKSEEETVRETAARCAEAEFHQVDMAGEVTIF